MFRPTLLIIESTFEYTIDMFVVVDVIDMDDPT